MSPIRRACDRRADLERRRALRQGLCVGNGTMGLAAGLTPERRRAEPEQCQAVNVGANRSRVG